MSKNTQTKKSATRSGTGRRATVQDFCIAMESIAPTGLAQSWDNVGLLVGDPAAPIRRIMACIDLTPAVVEEGIRKKTDLILAYHPPIFKPVSTIRADSSDMDAVVFRCIQHGMAIYATHTALDAAEGGTNDVIAALCGINETQPLEYADEPGVHELKLVTFVPADRVDTIAEALFAAGAGRIGDYDKCSYRIPGQGTFFGSESTNPSIGRRGRLERIDEIRLETVVPTTKLPAVVNALMSATLTTSPRSTSIHSNRDRCAASDGWASCRELFPFPRWPGSSRKRWAQAVSKSSARRDGLSIGRSSSWVRPGVYRFESRCGART